MIGHLIHGLCGVEEGRLVPDQQQGVAHQACPELLGDVSPIHERFHKASQVPLMRFILIMARDIFNLK